MIKTLKITLLSDLCVATGKHYAAMIDTDTALDEFGLPFIPSRRLKGCLRETALYFLDDESIGRIFGVSGSSVPGSLSIGNAVIADYADHAAAVKGSAYKDAAVSELFCSVRGQTAIEDGRAADDSLRYTRVVNRMDPLHDGKPLSFYAEVSFDEGDEEVIRKTVAGLKNIGYKRNRGLGLVKCELIDSDRCIGDVPASTSSEQACLRLTVELVGDLMLPDTDTNHTRDHIPGTMLIGAMASRYLKRYGDDGFNDIFYSDVLFGNLYPAVPTANGFGYTIPVPRFLAKIKAAADEDRGIRNLLNKDAEDRRTYKALKSGYVTRDLELVKPEKKIVYHNSNIGSADQNLYMQFCLSSGQFYSGTILGSPDKLNKLAALFSEGQTVNFGKSKTAQYSSCRIIDWKWEEQTAAKVSVKNGIAAAYVLESDVELTDESGIDTCSCENLCKALSVDVSTVDGRCSGLSTGIISGYNAKWNLKKPQVSVLSAGSCIVFYPETDAELPEYVFIGERQNEGFGRVRLMADAAGLVSGKIGKHSAAAPEQDGLIEKLDESSVMDSIIAAASHNAVKAQESSKTKLESSQIGRLMLMLKEADRSTDQYKDFIEHIESIKTRTARDKALALFKEQTVQTALSGNEFNAPMEWKFIRKYIATVLTVMRYRLKAGGKNDD